MIFEVFKGILRLETVDRVTDDYSRFLRLDSNFFEVRKFKFQKIAMTPLRLSQLIITLSNLLMCKCATIKLQRSTLFRVHTK